jgi:hypothetical protein
MSFMEQPSHNIKRAVLVAAAALAGSLAIAAPSHAATEYAFQPINLTAYDLEDPEPDTRDELRLTVGGTNWTGSVTRGETVPGSAMYRVRFSSSSVCITLTELDASAGEWWSSDDILGSTCVAAGDYTSHVRFVGNSFDYVLRFSVAPVAYTPPSLSVTVHCDTAGDYRIICDAWPKGGSGPYTITWSLNGRYLSGKDNQTTIVSGCSANRVNTVTVSVRDAAGASVQETTSVDCPAYAY